MKRRDLLKMTALGALAGPRATWGQAVDRRAPASDRIRVGMIGVGNFGLSANLPDFMKNPDVDVVALCDVDEARLDKAAALAGGKARRHRDYRRLLDDHEVDAVVITTPEHWHALMAIDACDAGKDVYLEKPVAHHIRDGRLIVEAARRGRRVVQVGTQQRSGAHFQRAVQYVRDGRIGDVHYAACWNHTPRAAPRPGVTGGPPPGLDWDMWLGPAPKLPYAEVMSVGRRGYWDFWGGMITEWGSHLADVVLWAMGVEAPLSVVAAGGQFFKKEGEIPDTLQVTYTYPGFLFHYSVLNHNTYGLNGDLGAARFGSYGMQFHGTRGTLFVDRGGFRITPQTTRVEEPAQPSPLPTTDSRQTGFYYTTDVLPEASDSSQQHGPHVRNFLDCVKSRKRPHADIEAGHAANTVCRLGNIAYRVGRRLEWDAEKEQVAGDSEANRLAVGTYREPWVPTGL
ncbi:MAG TPA: Gfo/Idh/MocA family oxidoreductase [Vicinamibacteria bacterium]|nr:Gfo/Idh/MocA family oxidoreductase [Vicinamibacteria bacterium]